jgi:hypothetical protein
LLEEMQRLHDGGKLRFFGQRAALAGADLRLSALRPRVGGAAALLARLLNSGGYAPDLLLAHLKTAVRDAIGAYPRLNGPALERGRPGSSSVRTRLRPARRSR